MARPAKERRASQRIYYCVPVKYRIAGRTVFHNAAASKNIGGGGLMLLLPEQLDIGSRIDVLLYPEDMKNPISARCRVAWFKRRKDGNVNTGVEFIKVKKYDQFIDFLCNKMIGFSLDTKGRRKTL